MISRKVFKICHLFNFIKLIIQERQYVRQVTQIETIKYDRDVSYSYAASRLSTYWTNHNMAWSDFMQKLAQTVRTKEEILTEYNKISKSEQADIKDVGGFVGGYLKEGKRRAGQVMNRSMLTLDIDYAAQDMTDILYLCFMILHIVYIQHISVR